MSLSKVGVVALGAAAAGALIVGGAALADAATKASSGTSATDYGGYFGYGRAGSDGPVGAGRGASADTPVTGDEAAKVTAAVKAKDSAVSVTTVRKDPDGSYDVLGTKNGNPVFYDVSKDLGTITAAGGRGLGGHGGSADTPVTGDEAAKVTAAVKAKDSAVSVTTVHKDPDGSYDVLGTKNGSQVKFEVSKDLKTITQNTSPGGRGGHGGHGPGAPGDGTGTPGSGSSEVSPSSTT